ncbi:MAG: type II secretion system protein [Armatimonadota bacterium]
MMKLDTRGNWTLIGLLAAVAIIVVLAAVYFGRGGGVTTVKSDSPLLDKSSTKQTVVGKSIETGKAAQCRQQLDQIRKGIETYKATNATETNPPTLNDIGLGVSTDFFRCPVSNQPYSYDPATGKVTCMTHPNY